ncbi:hypothetical protein U9725_23450 [Escherichia coli]
MIQVNGGYMINFGKYCREYRMSKGVTLAQLSPDINIKTLSAFEMGRSSNIKLLEPYIKLSIEHNESHKFFNGLTEGIK